MTPLPLGPSAPICAVASSGPFDDGKFRAGVALVKEFFGVRVPGAFGSAPAGFLAATDEERLAELRAAWAHPEKHGIWLARGGYGLGRILPRFLQDLDLSGGKLPWWIGFSDATVLHIALNQRGVVTLHAPNLTTIAEVRPQDAAATVAFLRGDKVAPISGLALQSGSPRSVRGKLFGGNLTVLFSEAAAGRLAIPKGALLVLEDVMETSYRVDRMLTALFDGGHFDDVGAVLLGEFVDCSPGKFKVTVETVLDERLSHLDCPVLTGLPVGHGQRNHPLPLGAPAEVDPAAGTLTFLPLGA